MKNFFYKLLLIISFFALVQCSGTGSKTKPNISSSSVGKSNLYFLREGGFVASGVLAKLNVNGIEIAKLGIKENIVHSVSGKYRIKISGAGIGGLGMGSDSISGIGDGKNYFYLISVKQGLFKTEWTINETTESGFKSN